MSAMPREMNLDKIRHICCGDRILRAWLRDGDDDEYKDKNGYGDDDDNDNADDDR